MSSTEPRVSSRVRCGKHGKTMPSLWKRDGTPRRKHALYWLAPTACVSWVYLQRLARNTPAATISTPPPTAHTSNNALCTALKDTIVHKTCAHNTAFTVFFPCSDNSLINMYMCILCCICIFYVVYVYLVYLVASSGSMRSLSDSVPR